MTKLIEINEENWPEAARLTVREEQRGYLDSAAGILTRGYVYRDCRGRVFGIAGGEGLVGLALVRDLEEEPACYDLQQFMIDGRFQGQGHGKAALALLLAELEKERRFPQVEVCVKKENAAALGLFEGAGFRDTGYVDESCPDCLNLMRSLSAPAATDLLIEDFTDPRFQAAFRLYFAELGIEVADWEALFREMNQGGNRALLRLGPKGETLGFIQFTTLPLTSRFFEETCGFIRELWVAEGRRSRGHGAALLKRAEDWFLFQGVRTVLLTTDTARDFYLRHGYAPAPACRAKNGDEVFVKHLTPAGA